MLEELTMNEKDVGKWIAIHQKQQNEEEEERKKNMDEIEDKKEENEVGELTDTPGR